ncbi:MAG: hypothetical protein GWN01_16695 [Nitrosopumilaceae archaeon]|nr:hypothetical protein [Nitrosopumilaceae archaeon]NIU02472.1 hypothetical protein [Nitrosopumilaceae archaeon]NIU88933.1 hypothetical protein [Nitrosopumilaceae archaeon]NIV67044.1 hypothetical protein [Nitrosopumilaceae archaeon]NIX63073.1 hypothetical protein [Nitrosopumilaceae archaeon]
MDNRGVTLHCRTAKNKLNEANFFLESLKVSDVWNDDQKFGYHLNSFIFSSSLVLDYIKADFIYHKIKPRISWYEYEDQDKRKQTIDNHHKKNLLKKFHKIYDKELDAFFQEPLANYFKSKKAKISHIQWNGSRWGSFTEQDGVKIFEKRYFEGLRPDYYKKTWGTIPLDMFDNKISESDKEKTLVYLCEENITQVCKKYLDLLQGFIQKFDGVKFETEDATQQEETKPEQDSPLKQVNLPETNWKPVKKIQPEQKESFSSQDIQYCKRQFWLL